MNLEFDIKGSYDVIIVGGGPGGYTAALYCARAALKTLIIEELVVGGQMSITERVENYPGFDYTIPGFDLALKMQSGAEKFGAETLYAKVESLNLLQDSSDGKKLVHTTRGTYQCKALILAMGAYPRRLDLANEQKLVGRGVSYCATCDGAFFRDKVVAVIGSGNSAVGEALVLSALCKKVYVITRGPRFKGEKSSIETLNKTENITAIHNSKVISLLENEGRVSAIEILDSTTEEAQILDCEGVFVSIGRIPNTKLCDEYIDTDPQGYILSDETTRTNIDGVYAVGDLRTKPLRQIITAASDGSVAAMYAEEYIRNL